MFNNDTSCQNENLASEGHLHAVAFTSPIHHTCWLEPCTQILGVYCAASCTTTALKQIAVIAHASILVG